MPDPLHPQMKAAPGPGHVREFSVSTHALPWVRLTIVLTALGAGAGSFFARALETPERLLDLTNLARGAAFPHVYAQTALRAGLADGVTLLGVAFLSLWRPGRALAALSLGLRGAAAGWLGVLLWAGFGLKGILGALVLVWIPSLGLIVLGMFLLISAGTGARGPSGRFGRFGRLSGAPFLGRLTLGLVACLPVVAWQAIWLRLVCGWLG